MNSFPPGGGCRETIPVLLALILSALSALAGDTNEILVGTLPAGGKIYTNAVITRATPAYVVVSYQDGLVQIPMSNLPAVYQTRFGYTPEKAAQFLDGQKQIQQKQRQAFLARQAIAQAQAGTNRPVRITAIIDETTYGGIPFCSADGITGGLLVKNLPDSVRQFMVSYRQLQADVADCQHELDSLKVSPVRTNAVAQPHSFKSLMMGNGGNYARVAPQNNNAAVAARNARQNTEDRLKALNARLDEETTNYDRYTTILAHPTGEYFGQKPIWICTGAPAPAAR